MLKSGTILLIIGLAGALPYNIDDSNGEQNNQEITIDLNHETGHGIVTYSRPNNIEDIAVIPEIIVPAMLDDIKNNERVKREEKNHEVGISVSRGGGRGTEGMVHYSYRFKRGLQDDQPVTSESEVNNGQTRVKREPKNHEVSASVSRGGGRGTEASIRYTYRFKRDLQNGPEPTSFEDEGTDGQSRVKREQKNHEVGISVSRGGGRGTEGMVHYSYRFKRGLQDGQQAEEQLTPSEHESNDGQSRVKREQKNHEVGISVSRGGGRGTEGMVHYSYRFKRGLQDGQQAPSEHEASDNQSRVKREQKNHEVGISVSRGGGRGTEGMVHYSYRFKRNAPDQE